MKAEIAAPDSVNKGGIATSLVPKHEPLRVIGA
jgi:hypothetical protein